MTHAETVVFAFIPAGESAEPSGSAQCPECLSPPCQNLMGVGLVAHIEYYLVGRAVIDIVIPDYQFHSTKAGSQVPRVGRADLDDIVAQLRAQLLQLIQVEAFDVGRGVYFV